MAARGTPGFSGVLSDKVVFVTGAGRGQGRTPRRPVRRIVAERGDVRDRHRLAETVARGVAEFGRIDFVLANAGILPAAGHQGRDITANTGRPPSHRGGFTAGRGLTLK